MKSSVRVSKQTKNDFYDSKQTKIVVDYFNSIFFCKVETNASMIHYIDKKKKLNINNSLGHTTIVHTFLNTSLYTTFEVVLMISSSSSVNNIFKPYIDVTRDI